MTIARRTFLKSATGIGAASSLGAWQQVAAALASDTPDGAFGFAEDRVPMNAANLCPMPTAISHAVARYSHELDRDLSSANRRRIENMKEDARTTVAAQLECSADELAIVRNTSEANSIVVQGLKLGKGDEVLLWDQNHPSNSLAWDVRAARDGFSVRRFSLPMNAASIDEVVAAISKEAGKQTRVVSFTHISNISGFRLPAAEICSALRRKRSDLHIHVDGAQTWGARHFSLGNVDCDSFSGSAHKWFMGPRETGLLFVREAKQAKLAATVVSIPWGNEVEPSVAGARRYEALGQRDDAAIAALAETAAWHAELTPQFVEQTATAIADQLRDALSEFDAPFVSSRHPDFRSNVIILKASREQLRELPQKVFEHSGVITVATGGLRMSPHIYNTRDHVLRVAAAVKRYRSLLGDT